MKKSLIIVVGIFGLLLMFGCLETPKEQPNTYNAVQPSVYNATQTPPITPSVTQTPSPTATAAANETIKTFSSCDNKEFANSIKNCTPANTTCTAENYSIQYRIIGGTPENCSYYLKISNSSIPELNGLEMLCHIPVSVILGKGVQEKEFVSHCNGSLTQKLRTIETE